ncbi:MAG: IS200/IS605 family transposase [Lachnospiraceae bacterium]|nr:IS200/IS605 family transposase [Lachnospiraceae bacterium]
MQNRYKRRNRRKYNLKVHIVLVTKYRKALLQNGIDSFVKRAIKYLAEQNDWAIIAMETDRDHIHILLEYDATERICDIISIIKQRTTRWLWIRYRDVLSTQYWKKHIFWSDGYFACSIGEVSSATIEKHIAEQG